MHFLCHIGYTWLACPENAKKQRICPKMPKKHHFLMGKFLTAHKKNQKISELSQNLLVFDQNGISLFQSIIKVQIFSLRCRNWHVTCNFVETMVWDNYFQKSKKVIFFSLKNVIKTLNLIFLPNIEFYHINHLCKV